MTDLTELIERVRNASGPDREIDAAITVALGAGPGEGWELLAHAPGLHNMDAGRWRRGAILRTPQPYTASIDAITALIEKQLPGWQYNLSAYGRFANASLGARDAFPEGAAPTAPLALCLAFLLAIQSQENSRDQ